MTITNSFRYLFTFILLIAISLHTAQAQDQWEHFGEEITAFLFPLKLPDAL